MSLEDSNTPAPPGARHGNTSRRGGQSGRTPLLIGLVLLLVVGVIGYFVLGRGGDDPKASDCVSEKVTLTTAPALEAVVKKAVASIEKSEPCTDVKLTVGTVKDVVSTLGDPDAKVPEIWIPDSPTWKGQLAAAGWTGTEVADVVAQTPVGLVGGPTSQAPPTWSAVLDGGRLSMADPSADGASALTLLAPFAEAKQTGQTVEEVGQKIVPVAQTYGERAVAGDVLTSDLTTISATTTQLVPATEQSYLAARRTNDQIVFVAPKSGVPMLKFPIISVKRGGLDVLASQRDPSGRFGRSLSRWFSSAEGRDAVAQAELRGADGEPLTGGIGLGSAKTLPLPDQKTTDEALRQWRVLSVPSSLLAVMDLSGSMKEMIGDTTRIQLAANAALVALDVLPDHARVGSWGFSKNRGGEGQSWQEYVPLMRLDAEAGDGLTGREFLKKDTAELPGRVRGGTGIIDTVLAAYKEAQNKWDPAYFNSVVFFTDGAADDTSSLKLPQLIEKLKQLNDPARPVKVIILGISQDADSPELAQIAAATGGQNYLVLNPDDILGVLAQAVLNR